jgi:DNA repair protein RecO (recombination protein O)
MTAEKSLAIVLRLVEFSESSLVVTLYTRDFGKISALAKGARRPKGPFESALDHLAICRVVFLRKSGDSLDLLTEAKLERRFRNRSKKLASLYSGYYIAELLGELTARGDAQVELFDLALRALDRLDGLAPIVGVVEHFELRMLWLIGHFPLLDACVECGGELGDRQSLLFAPIEGGTLCEACREGKRTLIRVSRDVLELMGRLGETAIADDELLSRVEPARGVLRGVLNSYLTHHFGSHFRLHAFLNR